MKIYSEARPAGGGKVVGVGLDDTDMADVDGWDALPITKKWRLMSDRADIMLVEYMVRRGDISTEFGAQRIREIQAGTPA